MTREKENILVAKRILFDLDIEMETVQTNAIKKDGSSLVFYLQLIGCESEEQVKTLINKYI